MGRKIESAQFVTVAPVGNPTLKLGDIVLCKVNGIPYLPPAKAISRDRIQVGNNKGRINGWTSRRNTFGIVTEISMKNRPRWTQVALTGTEGCARV